MILQIFVMNPIFHRWLCKEKTGRLLLETKENGSDKQALIPLYQLIVCHAPRDIVEELIENPDFRCGENFIPGRHART